VREGQGDFSTVARIVSENGSLEYSRALAQREANKARTALQPLPETIFRDSLLHLIDFALDRRR